MANLASTSIPLGEWADLLFETLFCQTDDALTASTFTDFVSPELVVKSNFDTYKYDDFVNLVTLSRQSHVFTTKSNDIVQVWEDPRKTGGGCVAQMSHFVAASKDDGSEMKKTSLSTVKVEVKDGKRVMTEMTEVFT